MKTEGELKKVISEAERHARAFEPTVEWMTRARELRGCLDDAAASLGASIADLQAAAGVLLDAERTRLVVVS